MPFYGNVMLDVFRQEPGPGGALLQGLFFGRVAPPRSERRTFETPALVLGHARDPIHPFSDAGMLAGEMPGARLARRRLARRAAHAPRAPHGRDRGFPGRGVVVRRRGIRAARERQGLTPQLALGHRGEAAGAPPSSADRAQRAPSQRAREGARAAGPAAAR